MSGAIAGMMLNSVSSSSTPIVPTFTNGSFADGEFVYNALLGLWTMPGWAIGNINQVWLNGVSTIQGWPTPTDPDPTPFLSTGEALGDPMTYNFELVTTDLPPSTIYPPNRACRLYSEGTVTVPYGLVNGPYLTSTTAVSLNDGDVATFWWKAANGSDAYNIIAYLLNIDTGTTIILTRATGSSPTASTPWLQVVKTFNTGAGDIPGNYKFVFISGTYDATGGQGVGASLYVTNITVTPA